MRAAGPMSDREHDARTDMRKARGMDPGEPGTR